MGIVSDLYERVSPERALKREIAKRGLKAVKAAGYSEHGASRTKKSLIGWLTRGASPDDDIVDNIGTLAERSRDLYMGTPIATGALKRIRTNVVGPGLKLNAQIDADYLGMSPEEADTWESNAEREFSLWADSQMCDAGAQNTFGQLQGLAFLSMLMSGDSFALLPVIPRKNSVYDIRVYLLEADRVCDPYQKDASRNIKGGVEIGGYGEPVAYHVAQKHPGSCEAFTNTWKRVPAFGTITGRRNIIHLMEMERPEQRRGVPILAPVMESLKQLGRYSDAELMAAVVSAMYTVFIKAQDAGNPMAKLIASAAGGEVDGGDDSSYELGNGAVVGLGPGEDIVIANPNRPNTAFDGFVTAVIKQIGTALEVPYELLTLHFAASYSASRAALLEAWKMFRTRRAMMASNFCQPIYEEWLAEAVARGRIVAPGFLEDPARRAAFARAEWNGPSQGQLDPLKEANAAKVRVEEGFSTRARETAELSGSNWDQLHRIRVREEQLRRDGGLVGSGEAVEAGRTEDEPEE